MTIDAVLFWIVAFFTLLSGLGVLLMINPIYCALCLALTMIGAAALFVTLDAYFLAGVQLIVYAGAVMVLFVMVLMLFDLKHEKRAFSQGSVSGFLKIGSIGLLSGLTAGSIYLSSDIFTVAPPITDVRGTEITKDLGSLLFSQYLFGFEALGILLLIVAVGSVALARSKGGTHAR